VRNGGKDGEGGAKIDKSLSGGWLKRAYVTEREREDRVAKDTYAVKGTRVSANVSLWWICEIEREEKRISRRRNEKGREKKKVSAFLT
jgi:hypothetical protein